MRRILFALTATFALAAAGPMLAHAMESQLAHAAVPQMAPVVLGEVSEMNSHSVTVRTGEGETLPFEFDSRTVMPMDIPAGTPVRVEFRMLDSGLHLAQRITPLERGSKDWDALEGAISQATETEESDYEVASNADNDHERNMTASNEEHHESTVEEKRADAREEAREEAREGDRDRDRQEVANTASDLPLFLGVGVLLLVGALALRWMRRRTV